MNQPPSRDNNRTRFEYRLPFNPEILGQTPTGEIGPHRTLMDVAAFATVRIDLQEPADDRVALLLERITAAAVGAIQHEIAKIALGR